MKKTNALIASVLVTSMLTSCGGTDTMEMTSAESTVSETTESEVTEVTEAATVSETDIAVKESIVTDTTYLHTWTDIICNLSENCGSSTRAIDVSIFDVNADGASELFVKITNMGENTYKIYDSTGAEINGLWQNNTMFVDYADSEVEASFKCYTSGNSSGLLYVAEGHGMFPVGTYVVDAVGKSECLTAVWTMADDYSSRELVFTVYKDGEVVDNIITTCDSAENGSWTDWKDMDAVFEKYEEYFGGYSVIEEDTVVATQISFDTAVDEAIDRGAARDFYEEIYETLASIEK